MTRVQRITEARRRSINWKQNLRVQKQRGRGGGSHIARARAYLSSPHDANPTPHTCSPRGMHYPNHDPTATRSVHALHCARCETRVGNSQFAPRDEPLHADLFIRDAVKRAPLQRCRLSRHDPLAPYYPKLRALRLGSRSFAPTKLISERACLPLLF